MQFADLYRRALAEKGLPELPIGMHSPATSPRATSSPASRCSPTRRGVRRIGRERGWGPLHPRRLRAGRVAAGLAVRRLARDGGAQDRLGGADPGLSRFQLKYSVGSLPHDQRLESIRLYGEEVVPRVRELLAADGAGTPDRVGAVASVGVLPRLVAMRTWIRRSLWDVVPRNQRDTDEALHRRQVVAAAVVARRRGGPGLVAALGSRAATPSTSRPSSSRWCGPPVAFLSGRLHLGRISGDAGAFVRPVLQPILIGLALVAIFVLGSLVVREIGPLADYVSWCSPTPTRAP